MGFEVVLRLEEMLDPLLRRPQQLGHSPQADDPQVRVDTEELLDVVRLAFP